MPLQLVCTNEEKVPVQAHPVTVHGRPATFDGPLRVELVSGDGTFEQDPETPDSFTAISGDTPGETVYSVKGDADLGEGVTLVEDTVTLTVTGANAAAMGLSAGTPIAK